MKSIILLLMLVTMLLVSTCVSATIVFSDNFNDGNYNQSPSWNLDLGGNVNVINNELNHDGMIVDSSDRYWSVLNSFKSFTADNKLEFSYSGLLKSQGNPQEGRGILLVLAGTGDDRYDLRIQDGVTSGFSTNQHSISLGYGTGGNIYDYIVTNFTPERDTFYNINAVRENGVWSLYVNDDLIGTHDDTLNIKEFSLIHMPMVGSVVVDNIKVKIEPSTNEVPEFGLLGLVSLTLVLTIFIFYKKR